MEGAELEGVVGGADIGKLLAHIKYQLNFSFKTKYQPSSNLIFPNFEKPTYF